VVSHFLCHRSNSTIFQFFFKEVKADR
jgi:hypothetical protein